VIDQRNSNGSPNQPDADLGHLPAPGSFPTPSVANVPRFATAAGGTVVLSILLFVLVAWVFLPSLHNGARAVELAQQADRLSGGSNPSVLGTVAAAYAETQHFDEALATAQKALQLASVQTNNARVEALKAQIRAYQSGSPYRTAAP
jgi:hypothetical protein